VGFATPTKKMLLDTPKQVRAFMDNTPGDAVLLVGCALHGDGGVATLQTLLPGLPVAHTHFAVARKVLDCAACSPHELTAVFLQHGQRLGTARLNSAKDLVFTLARNFRNMQYAPTIMPPPEVCRGIGHIHVHLSTCMVIPRFAKASDHMRVLHKMLQYPLLMERVCLHQEDGAQPFEPWLANDLGHRLVGAHSILTFLTSMRVEGATPSEEPPP